MPPMSPAPTNSGTWQRFDAIGTYVHLETGGRIESAVRLAKARIDELDRACSRFRSDSDLSRVNAQPGTWVEVGETLITALQVALDAAQITHGLVDPCLGRSLVALGYDRDFASLTDRGPIGPIPVAPGAWERVEIDPHGAVRIPAEVTLDLGATAKAWAADVIAEEIVTELGTPVLISLGGDLRIAAPAEQERDWSIRISEHPDDDSAGGLVQLDGGGLATSSTQVRRWRAGSVVRHHLLDPRTGHPVTGPWRTVTATGPTATAANVASTAALVLQDAAVGWLTQHDVDARLIDVQGRVRLCGHWPNELTEPIPAPSQGASA